MREILVVSSKCPASERARSQKTFDKRFLRELQLLLMSDFVVKQIKRMLQLLDRNEVRVAH